MHPGEKGMQWKGIDVQVCCAVTVQKTNLPYTALLLKSLLLYPLLTCLLVDI